MPALSSLLKQLKLELYSNPEYMEQGFVEFLYDKTKIKKELGPIQAKSISGTQPQIQLFPFR